MAHTPLAEDRATDPWNLEGRSARSIPLHGNAVDAAGIRAELDARMAATGQHRGDGDRTAAIRDMIDRIGEILSGEPDPPAGSDAAASPDADLPFEPDTAVPDSSDSYGVDATVADAWLDSLADDAGWPADHNGASQDFPVTDTRYGPDAFATDSAHAGDIPQDGAGGLAEWAASELAASDSDVAAPVGTATKGTDDDAPPDQSPFGEEPGQDGADGSAGRIAAADPFAGEILANGPLGYWRLGERDGSDDLARDETGTAAGTWAPIHGPDTAAVAIPDHPAWRLAEGTVQFWMRPTGIASPQGLIARCDPTAGQPGMLAVSLESNDIAVQLPGPNGGSMTARGVIADRAWHQVAIAFGPDGLEIWIDGTLVARDPTITAGIDAIDGGWLVGAAVDPGETGTTGQAIGPFTGRIAELAIFDSQLGVDAIRGLYDAGINGTDVMLLDVGGPADDPAATDMIEPAAPGDVIAERPGAEWAAGFVPAGEPAQDTATVDMIDSAAHGDALSNLFEDGGFGEAGFDDAGPVLVEPPAASEPVEDPALSDIDPAANVDASSDFANGGVPGETGADRAAASIPADPPAADPGDVAMRLDPDSGDPIDGVPTQPGTDRTLAGGWSVTLTSGTVEADDGVSLILSGNAAGIITLPDGSEIRFDRMTRIDYGPRCD